YDIGSAISSFYETGIFEITAGCDPDHVDAVVTGVLAELRRLCDGPPAPEELQRIKDYTRGRFVIGLEDTYSVATWAGNQRALRGAIRPVEEILAQIEQVTPSDLQRVAQRIFRAESLCLAAIGPLPPAEHFTLLLKL
ncbi:MAG TPA: insulinase family protein, partial [Ktedonobacterales bacterium]|nr:insulinase family protein [Ktedonobacterales bacterium]